LNSNNSGTINGFVPVTDLSQSFAWVSGMTDGGGNAHPRDMWQFELLDSATIDLQRGRTGQELSYRYFVVELPTEAGAPPSDTTSPTTSITSPAGGATVSATITISATASDNVGVTQVQFFVDGVLLSTDTTAPYSASWDTTTGADGAHSLTAQASDAAGNTGISAAVNVTVNTGTPPQGSVSISGPASMDRGDRASYTVTLTNTGSSTINGVSLSFAVSPNSLLKNVSPGSSVAVGNVAPGARVSQTWNVRGDNEGSGTITGGASSGGTTLDTVTQSLTVFN